MNTMTAIDHETRALLDRLNPHRDRSEVLAHIAWSVLTEPGDAIGGALRSLHGAAGALDLGLSDAPLDGIEPEALREARERWQPRAEAALLRGAIRWAVRLGLTVVLPADPGWPRALDDLGVHAPAALWVRGDPAAMTRGLGALSIVGARAATAYGEHIAREIAGDLAALGILIVSGGAYGIDGAAHRAALGVGGATVAFLAGGLDRFYPAGHTSLLERIAATAALVSEVPCGGAPTKWRFLQRNRLIAALGAATVVVEAGARSGSLNTAAHAATLARPLGAVPGPVTSAASAGCHRLLREFDAQCITSAAEVRELMGDGVLDFTPATRADQPEHMRLRDALSTRSPRTPAEIARRTGMSLAEVESLLGVLALEGQAVGVSGAWRRV